MTTLVVDRFEEQNIGDTPSWFARNAAFNLGFVDMRTLGQMGTRGGPPEGFALFAYPDGRVPASPFLNLGNDLLNRILRASEKDAWRTAFNVPIAVGIEDNVIEAIRQLFFDSRIYDPTGVTAHKPLLGTINEGARLTIGGFDLTGDGLIFRERRRSFWEPTTIDVFQADFRRNVDIGMTSNALRRWTSATMLDVFGVISESGADKLMPPEHRSIGFERPATIISDTFVDANGTAITAHNPTPDNWGPWTQAGGSIEIQGNTVTPSVSQVPEQYAWTTDDELSTDDHSTEIEMITLTSPAPTVNAAMGALTRVIDEDSFYRVACQKNGAAEEIFHQKKVSGAFTTFNLISQAFSLPDIIKHEVDGNSLKMFFNGVQVGPTVTDASLTGQLRPGLMLVQRVGADTHGDNWNASDLREPPPEIILLPQYGQIIMQPTGPEYAQQLSETGDTFPQYGQVIKVDPKPIYAQEFLKEADDDQYGQRIVRD